MKLTLKYMQDWETDNGEHFIMDGPLDFDEGLKTEALMIFNMKVSQRGLEIIQLVVNDSNSCVDSLNDLNTYEDLFSSELIVDDLQYETYQLYADAFNSLGYTV